MARRFALVEVDFQDYVTDLIGISKDATIISGIHIADNYGGAGSIDVGSIDLSNTVIEIAMPTDDDILGLDQIESVTLRLKQSLSSGASAATIVIIEIPDDWTEGVLNGAPGECNWTLAKTGIPWSKGNGAILSAWGALDSSEDPIDSEVTPAISGAVNVWLEWDLTRVLSLGDKKTFVLFMLEATVGTPSESMRSTEYATAADRPMLRITYRDYPPEGFDSGDNRLIIQPDENDPEQPELTWGSVDSADVQRYVIYKDNASFNLGTTTNNITSVNQGLKQFKVGADITPFMIPGVAFPVEGSTGNDKIYTCVTSAFGAGSTTITVAETIPDATVDGTIRKSTIEILAVITDLSQTSYIDTESNVDGTQYFYQIVAEDLQNVQANGRQSSVVSFTKPDVATASMSPSGAQNVGTETTMTVTSGNLIKRVYVDWKDGTQSWYEFDVVSLSQAIPHIYTDHYGAALTPDVRVEDDLGFWSDLTAADNTITPGDTTPKAKLLVNVKKDQVGAEITLNASLSQPKGSNVTITKYEFKRDGSDSWQDNGTDPVYTFDSGTYPNSVGVKTASVRITTSSSLQDTDTTDYELETGTPTELTFTADTKVHQLDHSLTLDKDIQAPLGSDGTEYEFLTGIRAERIVITGTSNHPNVKVDIDKIRSAFDNDTYIRITNRTEYEGVVVKYDGKIIGDVSLGQAYDNKQSWSFTMIVYQRTEV